MNLDPPNLWSCSHCHLSWDKDRDDEEPPPRFGYVWPSVAHRVGNMRYDVRVDLDWFHRHPDLEYDWRHYSLSHLVENPPMPPEDSYWRGGAERDIADNEKVVECLGRGHQWQGPDAIWPSGTWSYEGLHVIKTGDYLKIYDKADSTKVLWDGNVEFIDMGLDWDIGGLRVHQDVVGYDCEEWLKMFIHQYPAEWERPEVPLEGETP